MSQSSIRNTAVTDLVTIDVNGEVPPYGAARTALHGLTDFLAGVFLFFANFAFVLWQNMHLAILYDLSFILETSTRISHGQIPYHDFPLPYAPVTFLVQAAIMKLFGRVVFHLNYA